jgi:2-polyprenyl-3-methyl-5-hydroxy-6-metoxy-1,4-benzoquinol methylase
MATTPVSHMQQEEFKPISVKQPSSNPLLFRIRCMVDLQLTTIVRHLRPAMAGLRGNVLDVGAGESPWREWLPPGAVYHGIDVGNADEFGMQEGRQGITYYDGRRNPFPDASIDGAICIEVLEHVEDPDAVVADIARCLRSGSMLLVSVPWSARRHHVPHDYHRFTRERLLRLFEAHGFERVDIAERGSDISAIASKLVVLSLRLAPGRGWLRSILHLPLFLLTLPIAAGFVVAAHVAHACGLGASEDPLGYFVKAIRR